MKKTKSNFFLPFTGLIAFTIGAIFLTFAPGAIFFEPGEPLNFLYSLLIPIFLLVLNLIILLISLFKPKK